MIIKRKQILIYCLGAFFLYSISNATETISFDYRFYIEFFEEIGEISFLEIIERVRSDFPYVRWADFGRFEFGFALVAYPLSLVFSATTVYAVIATVSLLLKLELLRRLGSSAFALVLFYIFDVMLFETNALRAGIALSFLALSLYVLVQRRAVGLFFLCLLVACSFHISSGFFFISGLAAFALVRIKQKASLYILTLMIGLAATLMIEDIFMFMGGKLAEYVIQAKEFGLYTGASGINSASVICFLFAMLYIGVLNRVYSSVPFNSRLPLVFLLLVSSQLCILIGFVGTFSIIGDRLWQLAFPLFLISLSKVSFPQTWNITLVLMRWRVAAPLVLRGLLYIIIAYYIFIAILLVYPQSNFFGWLTGYHELTPPQVR